jgi:hypothetical protein
VSEGHSNPARIWGHPALWLLAKLKLRGFVRLQVRRVKRPAGMAFFAIGLLLAVVWLASLFTGALGGWRQDTAPADPRTALFTAQAAVAVLVLLAVIGALQFRGLFLPREEIERLFSAPLTRRQLVRYRLSTAQMRSLFGAALFGLACAQRVGNGAYGFFGAGLTLLTIPVLGQAAAILAGDAENRWLPKLRKLPLRFVSIAFGVVFGLFFVWLVFGRGDAPIVGANLTTLRDHPVLNALLAPCLPWARAMTAPDLATFAPYFAVCVLFFVLARMGTEALRVDFRELSLETSADVARRLNRMRKGGAANRVDAARAPFGWTPPWLFGRSPFGAIARNELAAMLRKARGTLFLLLVAAALLTAGSSLISRTLAEAAEAGDDVRMVGIASTLILTLLGTTYLCSSLRFDFRSRLHQMDQLKAWPVTGATVFLGTIAAETLLVWVLVSAGLLVPGLWHGRVEPWALVGVAFQPLLGLAWIAIDNAVYLYAPTRYTPGEDSAFLHMGRALVLLLVRLAVMTAVLLFVGTPCAALLFMAEAAGFDSVVAWTMSLGVAWVALGLVCGGLVWVGGKAFERFDVARDRG